MNGKYAKHLRRMAEQNPDFSYRQWKKIYKHMKNHGDQLRFEYRVKLGDGDTDPAKPDAPPASADK